MKNYFKKKIEKVIIVFRDEQTRSFCLKAVKWLDQKNIKSVLFCQDSMEGEILKESADLLLVLGGDGTYLSAVRFAQNKTIPMLGVNMGSLGFLTVHVKENLLRCLEHTLQGRMVIDERCLIQISEKNQSCLALNDVVIERGETSQLIDISVYLEDKPIYSVKADGLIISSATGSTAYNLSAGGPILHPTVNAFVVTPICPHSLTHRPVLFPDDQILKFQLKTRGKGVRLTVDGRKQTDLFSSSCVVIQKSKQIHQTLKDPDQCDFIYLKDKLKFFDRSV